MTLLVVVALLGADPALVAGLRSDDATVRLATLRQVERLGTETPAAEYVAPLAALARHPDLPTRGLAMLALSRHVVAVQNRAPAGVVVALAHGLRDENPHVVGLAARALRTLGPRAIADIRAATDAQQPRDVRLAALEVAYQLATLPACTLEADYCFWLLFEDADARVRGRATALHRLLRAEQGLPAVRDLTVLAGALRNADPLIRLYAAQQLTDLGGPAVGALIPLLEDENRTTRAEVRLGIESDNAPCAGRAFRGWPRAARPPRTPCATCWSIATPPPSGPLPRPSCSPSTAPATSRGARHPTCGSWPTPRMLRCGNLSRSPWRRCPWGSSSRRFPLPGVTIRPTMVRHSRQ